VDPQFRCGNENRRRLVAAHGVLNGIDYLEVMDQAAEVVGLPRQHFLLVHFLNAVPALTEQNVRIEAPPRAAAVNVLWARPAAAVTAALVRDPQSGATLSASQRDVFHHLDDAANTLVVLTDATGDFSSYTLRLVTSPTDEAPPANQDQRLSALAFSFKVECPSDFDCVREDGCPPELFDEPAIDYLAKDYASFRLLMLDRLSVVMPDWEDRSPADLQVAMVELLAYVGDHLSYYQDAVAAEAYLGTARRRPSVRRHARLLDYRMHDGCNARAWVHLTVQGGAVTLPAGARLTTRGADPLVFEAMHDAELHSENNEISFHTWGDTECCLPAGATRATLRYDAGLVTGDALLAVGDVLIFEEVVSPTTGRPSDADRERRCAVRLTVVEHGIDALDGTPIAEIAWHEADALPFPVCVSAVLEGAALEAVSVARGNVVLADHGETITDPAAAGTGALGGERLLEPVTVPRGTPYRPVLRRSPVTFRTPWDPEDARTRPASAALKQNPRAALPFVTLDDGDELWTPRADLLASDRFAPEFVAEAEVDGTVRLRFGDDVLGKAPAAGSTFRASYRVGSGTAGNVGPDALARVVGVGGIRAVRNPLPARGGTPPESMEEVRQYAPRAFRTQERAVTAADYAEVTSRHPEVQRAAATFRWTGSWTTVFITVDRMGGLPVLDDPRFLRKVRAHIERYRLAGYDLEINDPVYVPLDLALEVCVAPGHFRSDVKRSVLEALGRRELVRGGRGFFHPDNFSFGDPVWLSQLYGAAMGVEGVSSVEIQRFQRWGEDPRGEIDAGVLETASLEIVRLENDPSRPGNGRLELDMVGGL
jgi:hypothetical protein